MGYVRFVNGYGMGGCLFVGSKDTLICGTGGFNPRLLSGRMPEVTPYIRRISGAVGYVDGPHEQDWLRACKESPENRLESTANFGYSGPFNEMVLLGVLAIRLQGLNKTLKWDAENMRFTNISAIGCMLSPLYILESIKRAISLESEGSWSVLSQKGLRIAVLAGTFFIFPICCIPVPFILKKIPETKGMSLEEIEEIWRVDGPK